MLVHRSEHCCEACKDLRQKDRSAQTSSKLRRQHAKAVRTADARAFDVEWAPRVFESVAQDDTTHKSNSSSSSSEMCFIEISI